MFTDKQKQIISENTGINDILAGQAGEGTLGATVILKEAAINRLIIPRNNVVSCLELDAYITVSWIKQTYDTEKIAKFQSIEEVSTFMKLNPNYFLREIEREYEGEVDKEDEYTAEIEPPVKSLTYGISKKVPLNFNIDLTNEDPSKDEIEELTDSYHLPATVLFDILQSRGHMSDKLTIVIDGSSMLLPSEEINKQRMTEIYTIVNPIIMQIMQIKDQMPDMARALMKSLERILEVNKETIYEWLPKDIYDQVMAGRSQQQPSIADIAGGVPPGQGGPSPETGTQGAIGGPMGATGQAPTPNQIPNPIGKMTQDFKSNFNTEIVNPMKGVMNASVKRAANSKMGQ